jgi:hypothetical protein
MGTASDFEGILREELKIHAAWLPITNTYRLGDYGLVSDGVFVRIGNIDSFGVSDAGQSGPESNLSFTSKDTNIVRIVGEGDAKAFPDADVSARLTIEFNQDRAFMIRAALTSEEMKDLHAVALALRQTIGWEQRFRVVSAVYKATGCTIVSAHSKGAKVEISGKANALKQLEGGSAGAGISVTSSSKLGLEIVGKSGVIGLGLFKLGFFGGPKVLSRHDVKREDVSFEQGVDLVDDL